jgi:hypothetical protein
MMTSSASASFSLSEAESTAVSCRTQLSGFACCRLECAGDVTWSQVRSAVEKNTRVSMSGAMGVTLRPRLTFTPVLRDSHCKFGVLDGHRRRALRRSEDRQV